jgi:hypothetical protein
VSDQSKPRGIAETVGFKWSEAYPDGRTIFYEGDDPDGFAEEIQTKFGFDPSKFPGINLFTGEPAPFDTWNEDCGFQFHCPSEHLDAIYGPDGRWPLGS